MTNTQQNEICISSKTDSSSVAQQSKNTHSTIKKAGLAFQYISIYCNIPFFWSPLFSNHQKTTDPSAPKPDFETRNRDPDRLPRVHNQVSQQPVGFVRRGVPGGDFGKSRWELPWCWKKVEVPQGISWGKVQKMSHQISCINKSWTENDMFLSTRKGLNLNFSLIWSLI